MTKQRFKTMKKTKIKRILYSESFHFWTEQNKTNSSKSSSSEKKNNM